MTHEDETQTTGRCNQMNNEESMTRQELMKYFNFDESDLSTNRNGALSARQNARLSQGDRSTRKLFLIAGLVSAVLVFLSTLILWLVGRLISVGWYSLLWIIPGGLLAFFLIRAGLKSVTFTLQKVEGDIEITKGGSYDDPGEIYYQLHIGDKQFGIGPELARRMKKENGETYAVYYYWGSDTVETDLMDAYIMSLEKISKTKSTELPALKQE